MNIFKPNSIKAESRNIKYILFILLFTILGLAIGGLVVYTNPFPSVINFDKYSNLQSNISKYIDTPSGESPTVAEITDIDVLKESNSALYSNAEEGDLLMVYTTKVIIFRPSINKIIDVYPLDNNLQSGDE